VKKPVIVSFLLVFCMLAAVLMSPTVAASTQQAEAKKYIAFRNDDIRPGMSLNGLKAVNQVHIDENVPVTLGIVPHPNESEQANQLLQDGVFVPYMQSIAPNPLFEFAQHGYSHTRNQVSEKASEFIGLSYDDQYNRILKGRTDFVQAFGMAPKTFIPPFDNFDSNTLKAVAALGFTEFSAGSVNDIQHRSIDGMQIDGTIEIGALNATEFSASIQNAREFVKQFLTDPQNNTLTITYHTSMFMNGNGTVDEHRIQQLEDFIGYLKLQGLLFTRLDRSDTSSGVVSPSPSTGLVPLPIQGSGASAFLLVGSVGIVLSGIYVSARRQDETNNKPNN
jgi:peptidoglycan/xylan/chitin deacetylase (PgdA/CDA1 family)